MNFIQRNVFSPILMSAIISVPFIGGAALASEYREQIQGTVQTTTVDFNKGNINAPLTTVDVPDFQDKSIVNTGTGLVGQANCDALAPSTYDADTGLCYMK